MAAFETVHRCKRCNAVALVIKPYLVCRSCWQSREQDERDEQEDEIPELEAGFPVPLPAEPTDTIPHTKARVSVYAERAARGEALFHPYDATCYGCSRPRIFREHRDACEQEVAEREEFTRLLALRISGEGITE